MPKRLLVALTAMVVVIFTPTVAFAQDNIGDANEVQVFVISAPIVQFISALIIPLVNGLITRYTLPSEWKFVITTVLNAAVALFTTTQLDDGTAAISMQTLYTTIFGVVLSVLMYSGIYSKVGLTSSLPPSQSRLASAHGIGPTPPEA